MELSNLINKIESLKQELSTLQPLMIDRQDKLDKKFRLEFNYNSNHIEGNTLTYGETELYLFFDKTTGDHDGREYEEMKASDAALKMIQELAADNGHPLTESFIKNLNKIILVRPYWAPAITSEGQQTQRLIEPGDYKKQPNSVRLQSGEMFNYAAPHETPALMGDLLNWYYDELEKKELSPIALAALLHYRFVRIHPFDDGNGRVSRLLMNYVLYRYGFPPVIIKSANKKEYLLALNKADTGDLNSFIVYIAQQMVWSLELSIKAAKGEEIEEHGDLEKEVELWKKELQNKNPVDAIPKSPALLNKLYAENLGPFIELFEKKISSLFKDFFNGWVVSGYVNNTGNNEGKKYIDDMMYGTLQHIGSVPLDINNVYSISLAISMSGFKKNKKNLFNLSISLELLFNDNNYYITVATPLGKTSYPHQGRIYNNSLSPLEKDIILNETGRTVFDYIKENTESPI